jgi:hypothetical protein
MTTMYVVGGEWLTSVGTKDPELRREACITSLARCMAFLS